MLSLVTLNLERLSWRNCPTFLYELFLIKFLLIRLPQLIRPRSNPIKENNCHILKGVSKSQNFVFYFLRLACLIECWMSEEHAVISTDVQGTKT